MQVLLQDFKVISLLAQVTFVERDQKLKNQFLKSNHGYQ